MHHDTPPILFALLVLLMTADAIVSIRRLRAGWVERNPLAAWAINLLGIEAGLIVPRVLVLAALWLSLDSMPWWALAALVAFYGYWAAKGFKTNQ